MKAHRFIEVGAIGDYKIRVVESCEINANECGSGVWVHAALECAAIVITRDAISYAFDIDGREISPEQIPKQ